MISPTGLKDMLPIKMWLGRNLQFYRTEVQTETNYPIIKLGQLRESI